MNKVFLDAATDASAGGLGIWSTIIMIAVFAVAMYFLVIRPQKKQEKEQAEMRNSLSVGDEVTTIGGIIGRVVSVKDDTFVLETSKERCKIRMLVSAIKSIDVRAAEATGVSKDKEETDNK